MIPEKAPIVEINNTNIDQLWPCIALAIRTSTFVALDTELSGLGSRKLLQAKNIEERYKSIAEAAKTRSILSIGLSCFKFRGDDDPENGNKVFLVQTFNILTLCSDEYVVEPGSLEFLVEHGFDFNKQYSMGIKYQRGKEDEDISKGNTKKPSKNKITSKPYLKMFIEELISSGVAIVLHNALLDLVFLYSNLYCSLPNNLTTFVADLNLMFQGGIFDTKVIAEFKMRMQASFLEYVYKKCLKENLKLSKNGKSKTVVEFLKYPRGVEDHLAWVDLTMPDSGMFDDGIHVLCQSFSNHGWCINGTKCDKSHNIDLVIQNECSAKAKKQKLKENSKTPDGDSPENPSKKARTDLEVSTDEPMSLSAADDRMHRAGFDAFMTGLSFAVFLTKYCKESSQKDDSCLKNVSEENGFEAPERWSSWGSVPKEFKDKVYLSGKDFPLLIARSTFTKPSKSNSDKLERIRGDCNQ